MTCKQCKHITVCMAQADGLGQVFDPNYDGEHGCTDFVPFINANRVRSMTDEELNERGSYTDITSLIVDINVNEIAEHIRCGNLDSWVQSWQRQMAFELENAKLSEKD